MGQILAFQLGLPSGELLCLVNAVKVNGRMLVLYYVRRCANCLSCANHQRLCVKVTAETFSLVTSCTS